MAILVAGVSAANLGLIYLSIAVSILAAVTLAVGVLLRRRELFGETGAAPQSDQPGRAAAETAKARPVPVRPAASDRVTADRGGRREDSRRDGEQPGDLAARLRKAGSGTAADTGSARWPASIAAKGAPATARRGGEHPAGGGRATRSPAGRGPAAREPGAREPARGDRAGRERDDPDPAAREPVAREATGREPGPTESTERGAGWLPRPGRAAGPGRPAEPARDRAGAGRDRGPAAARPDREPAARGRGRGERDRAAAARADRARTPPGRDRGQEAPARRDREQAGRERGEAAAGQQAEAFRLPPQSERTRARAEELGRAISGDPARDDFWDRVSDELVDSGSQDPVRPAWPATAGPRAMGTGSAARRAPGETGDKREEPRSAGSRQPEPAPRDREAIPRPSGPLDEEHDGSERQAGADAEVPWDRVVPPYVDDLARHGRQQREPERQPAGADEPDDGAARAGATAGPASSSTWSAWSSTRAGDQGTGADAGEAGRDSADRDTADDEHAVIRATAGAPTGTETGAAGATGDHEAEAGVRGDAAADETADRAEPGVTAPGEAERPGGGDDPGETAGGPAGAESQAQPGSTHDAADTSRAVGAEDAGSAGESGAAGADADGSPPLDDEVTVVPGVPRYHRRGCILIRFLSDGDLETTTRRAAEAAGLVPCKACQPDKPASAG
jgi:hypothetical protein